MTHLETNIFPIANLEELSSEYRLYRIKGLRNDHGEYYSNCQYITRTLSFSLQRPVLVIERDGVPYLVVRADAVEPPSPFQLVRAVVNFELCSDTLQLDYTLRTPENDAICLRFLQFMLQEPIRTQLELWQPASGQAFFPKSPSSIVGNLHQYTGYSVRAGLIPEGSIGLYVEITNKFVGKNPLPVYLSRDEFPKWKGKHCIYHYGHNWYEILIVGLDDRHVTEYLMPKDGKLVNLLEFIMAASKKPIPPELAELPHDSSVLLYKNNRNEDRGAPAHLCYPVYSNDTESSGSIHARAILPPHIRDRMTREFAQRYLSNLRFGGTQLRVSLKSMKVPSKTFSVPDLKFGQSKILSVRGSPNAQYVSLNDLGAARLALLKDVGFYTAEALDRQYFIIPRSVADSYGKQFLNDLYRNVDELFTQEGGYTPVVVTYNDTGPKTFSFQGRAILEAVKAECKAPGYGVVMIHHVTDRQNRQEDKLAGMVTQELRKLDICVAIIHSKVGQECYELVRGKKGEPCYSVKPELRGRLAGYLRNISLTKVLLTNQRWPFILGTRLHADITVGIDVKQNTTGFVIVGHNGDNIRPLLKTSRQKEKLDEQHMKAWLGEIIRQEANDCSTPIQTIVIHRDGKAYPPEIKGACQAIEMLQKEGVIANNATLTILEIPKKSPAPLRLFDVGEKNGQKWVENPQLGNYVVVSDTEGYICSTGRAFRRPGTVNPLHIRRVYGCLPLEDCLEDVFYLTALAWTRPEDCTRYPITLKLNDRFLSEDATDYDPDDLDIVDSREESDE